jgi:outer membrane protein TolC
MPNLPCVRILAFLLCALALASHAGAQESLPPVVSGRMDMGGCVLRALEANPQIKSAREKINGAIEGVRASGAAFAPTGTASYVSQAGNTNVPGSFTQKTALDGVVPGAGFANGSTQSYPSGVGYLATLDLNVHQPLFTGFKLLSAFQKARLAKDQAEALFTQAELALIRSVQSAFLALLKDRANVKAAEASIARLESQLKTTQAFYEEGLRTRLDTYQAEADLATARETLLSAQNAVDIQLVQLDALLNILSDRPDGPPGTDGTDGGRPRPVEYVGELARIPFTLTLEAARDEAFRRRPDLAVAVKSVEMAEKDAAIALSSALPHAAADYDNIREGDRYWLRGKNVAYTERNQLELSATWKAWDFGNTAFNYRQAGDTVKKLQADLATLRLAVGVEVKTQYLNILDAAKRIDVARAGQAAANEAYRQAAARYKQNVATNTDVLIAQAQVTNADYQVTQALSDYQAAIVSLYYSMGRKNPNLDGSM